MRVIILLIVGDLFRFWEMARTAKKSQKGAGTKSPKATKKDNKKASKPEPKARAEFIKTLEDEENLSDVEEHDDVAVMDTSFTFFDEDVKIENSWDFASIRNTIKKPERVSTRILPDPNLIRPSHPILILVIFHF